MLINLSNHPYNGWNEAQQQAALFYGEVIDLPFPIVDASGDESYITSLINEYEEKILELSKDREVTVHLMGEMTFTFALVAKLQRREIQCVASTTERIVREVEAGRRGVLFRFVRFRKYLS